MLSFISPQPFLSIILFHHILAFPLTFPLDYHSLRSIYTLTERIKIFFSKKEFVFLILKLYIFHHLLWYYDMTSEIIQNVAYANYDDFQHVNFVFSQNFNSLFWRLFNDETNFRVRYSRYQIITKSNNNPY